MPSAIAHSTVALAFGSCFPRDLVPRRAWLVGALTAALPDLDVLSFRFGISYVDLLGHRGLLHSIAFAAIVAMVVGVVSALISKKARSFWVLFCFVFLCTVSHGVLDAMTDGGYGVAFFAPFDNTRYFLPWRPIAVAPLNPARFFTPRGLYVLGSEMMWVVLPSLLIALAACTVRTARTPGGSRGNQAPGPSH